MKNAKEVLNGKQGKKVPSHHYAIYGQGVYGHLGLSKSLPYEETSTLCFTGDKPSGNGSAGSDLFAIYDESTRDQSCLCRLAE
jgi:hypothetical protein